MRPKVGSKFELPTSVIDRISFSFSLICFESVLATPPWIHRKSADPYFVRGKSVESLVVREKIVKIRGLTPEKSFSYP